tara:strand:- start:37 stop:279 length:243 start_codon:yes stop_codon:yes gene_type:complete
MPLITEPPVEPIKVLPGFLLIEVSVNCKLLTSAQKGMLPSNLFVCHPVNSRGVKSTGKKDLGVLGEVDMFISYYTVRFHI